MQTQLTAQQVQTIQATFINKVYAWMCLALTVTGFIAYRTAQSDALLGLVFGNSIILIGLIIFELGIVFWMSKNIAKISSNMAIGLFILYSALNGLTLSVLLLVYTASSIASTFYNCRYFWGYEYLWLFHKKRFNKLGKFIIHGIDWINRSLCNKYFFSKFYHVLDYYLCRGTNFCWINSL